MFSVDNFYDFVDSHYGRKKTNTLLLRFNRDGSKSFQDLVAVSDTRESRRAHVMGFAILHDQEPFDRDFLNTYRQWLYQAKNNATWLSCTQQEIFMAPTLGLSWPIIGHSEKNSEDIRWAVDHGAIECYYFWHGLIARDWYRHWKHHADLQMPKINFEQRFLLYCRAFDGTRQYRKTLVENLASIKDHIKYHWDQSVVIESDASAKISVQDAQQTAIHIVAETLFSTSKIHATEKIFKPMVMSQPFIVAGAPGILNYLRDYGFKTFDHIWDESYDLEIDHHKRLSQITNLITDLSRKTHDEFLDIMQACQSIVEHNRKHFFSDAFEQIMLTEFHTNWQSAIQKQIDLQNRRPGGNICWVVDQVLSRNHQLTDSMKLALNNAFYRDTIPSVDRDALAEIYPWINDLKI